MLLVLLVVVRTQHLRCFWSVINASLFAARHHHSTNSILFWTFNYHFHLSRAHRWYHLIRSSIIWLVIAYVRIWKVLCFITTIKYGWLIHKTGIERILLNTIRHHCVTLIWTLLRSLWIAATYQTSTVSLLLVLNVWILLIKLLM